jgi:hypothetical protein
VIRARAVGLWKLVYDKRRTSLKPPPFLERSWRKNGETSNYENSPPIFGGMSGYSSHPILL